MEEHLEKFSRDLKNDDSTSLNIVGRFCIKNQHYLVIHIEDIAQNFTDIEFNCCPPCLQNLEVAHFKLCTEHFVIVEAESYQLGNKSHIPDILTERERQIVRLVAQGNPNKLIARNLHISEWTVSTYLRRIFAKLGVDSRAAMVYKCNFLI